MEVIHGSAVVEVVAGFRPLPPLRASNIVACVVTDEVQFVGLTRDVPCLCHLVPVEPDGCRIGSGAIGNGNQVLFAGCYLLVGSGKHRCSTVVFHSCSQCVATQEDTVARSRTKVIEAWLLVEVGGLGTEEDGIGAQRVEQALRHEHIAIGREFRTFVLGQVKLAECHLCTGVHQFAIALLGTQVAHHAVIIVAEEVTLLEGVAQLQVLRQ